MDNARTPTADAAELVLRERERARKEETRRAALTKTAGAPAEPQLETVSVPKWAGAEAGEVDESELERRQRSIAEQLERKQEDLERTGRELSKLRAELKALEEPIKAEIMTLRERLEGANRTERTLVGAVNGLRKDLFEKEKGLAVVREEKQKMADDLIRVMADYERRKTERLNQIAQLLGEDSAVTEVKGKKSGFLGF